MTFFYLLSFCRILLFKFFISCLISFYWNSYYWNSCWISYYWNSYYFISCLISFYWNSYLFFYWNFLKHFEGELGGLPVRAKPNKPLCIFLCICKRKISSPFLENILTPIYFFWKISSPLFIFLYEITTLIIDRTVQSETKNVCSVI